MADGVHYRIVNVEIGSDIVRLGLLLIPKRPTKTAFAQFQKNAPKSATGKSAYNHDDVYFRQLDACKKAVTAEELEFLFSSRLIDIAPISGRVVENNLPARDVELSKFIGRDKEMYELWIWLSDAFSPIKILSGLGGVGKTSIAYTFAERVIYDSPSGIDRVVWLGAKEESFSAFKSAMVPTSRVDFRSIDMVLEELLLESGCPSEQIPENPSRDQLMKLVQEHLSAFAYLVVLDNLDTLDDEDQQQIFHIMTQLCSKAGAKTILTARRNLGAPRPVYMQIGGMELDDFAAFVIEKYDVLKLKPAIEKTSPIIAELYEASNGSPLFAMSILRLFWLGDPLKDAIRNWKGLDGNAVRSAAFRREIGRLNNNEGRVLLALCYLNKASAEEISSILGMLRYDVQNAIETLQAFSMTSIRSALPGGAVYQIPSTLSLVSDLIEKRVADWEEIRGKCRDHEKLTENRGPFVGKSVRRVIARLNGSDFEGAREVVEKALARMPNQPDLVCLAGKVHLDSEDFSQAGEYFLKAFELGCRKRELFDGWIKVLTSREEWRELDKIALVAEQNSGLCQYCITRAEAVMFLGDQLSRAGDLDSAEKTYRDGLEIVRAGLKKYNYPADRANLWRTNEILGRALI